MNLKSKKKSELIKMLEGALPDLKLAELEKLSWIGLPFIPEDLLFLPLEQENTEHGLMRIYYRDGISCMRLDENSNWVVKTPEFKMNFKITSKFHAYQLFTMIGLKVDPYSSSVTGMDRTVQEILKEGASE